MNTYVCTHNSSQHIGETDRIQEPPKPDHITKPDRSSVSVAPCVSPAGGAVRAAACACIMDSDDENIEELVDGKHRLSTVLETTTSGCVLWISGLIWGCSAIVSPQFKSLWVNVAVGRLVTWRTGDFISVGNPPDRRVSAATRAVRVPPPACLLGLFNQAVKVKYCEWTCVVFYSVQRVFSDVQDMDRCGVLRFFVLTWVFTLLLFTEMFMLVLYSSFK